jgi:Fe-S-cluster-containing dehydrogenase component
LIFGYTNIGHNALTFFDFLCYVLVMLLDNLTFTERRISVGKDRVKEEKSPSISRRDLLRGIMAAGAAVVAVSKPNIVGASTVKNERSGFAPLPQMDGNVVLRMQADLRRAMAKPIEQRKWIMVIDLRKCIGCSACTIACKAENQLPPGVVYRPVMEEEIGEYPDVTRRFIPRPCMQCENPPCVKVCPVAATYKRPDGIVEIDYTKCIGCRYCIPACPYSARTFDFGEFYTDHTPERQPYEEQASPEYGKKWNRKDGDSPVGNVRKCQFCLHRLNAGMLPACVTTCIGGATYFGDKNDSESLVFELVASGKMMRLKEDLGTEPKVYYLV